MIIKNVSSRERQRYGTLKNDFEKLSTLNTGNEDDRIKNKKDQGNAK
jgi:hypothetical protein